MSSFFRKKTFMQKTLRVSLIASSLFLHADMAEDTEVAIADTPMIGRKDSIPDTLNETSSDAYLEGYVQALVDTHFYEHQVTVVVKDRVAYLTNLPKNDLLANSIILFVKDVPQIKEVKVSSDLSQAKEDLKEQKVKQPRISGVWFPQQTVLFPPLVADPRDPTNMIAYRFGDRVIGRTAAAISIGDDFSLFRWKDIMRWHGDLQIGIQGAVWAVFNYSNLPHSDTDDFSELVNADYYFGIPLTYAFDKWAFRLRGYHISSHLGDEFIVNNPRYLSKRVNPSYEAIDFFTSYQFSGKLRGYFGPGVIVHSDRTFPMKYLYAQYGIEFRFLGQRVPYHGVYGTPFLAIHLDNYQVRHWSLDQTYRLGYEWSKMQGIGRKVRVFLEYHQGFSWEGQFFKERTKYGQLGFSWGF
jgi:hypothetical protein